MNRSSIERLLNSYPPIRFIRSRFTAGTVVKSTYGHEVKSNDDELVQLATEAVIAATSLGMMGLTPVDFAPFCELY